MPHRTADWSAGPAAAGPSGVTAVILALERAGPSAEALAFWDALAHELALVESRAAAREPASAAERAALSALARELGSAVAAQRETLAGARRGPAGAVGAHAGDGAGRRLCPSSRGALLARLAAHSASDPAAHGAIERIDDAALERMARYVEAMHARERDAGASGRKR
jgi:hypothetical protein